MSETEIDASRREGSRLRLRTLRLDPFAVVCVAAAVAIRLGVALGVDAEPLGDAQWYYRVALSVVAGEGWSYAGAPTAYRPPGYPAFLAAVFTVFEPSPRAGAAANALLAGVALPLVYALTRLLVASRSAARLAVLALALYPNHIAYTSLLLGETLFTTLSLLGAWLVLAPTKRRVARDALAGVVLGAACLVRPQAALLPLVVLAYTRYRSADAGTRAVWPRLAVIGLALAAVVTPWTARNWAVFGRFVPVSTNLGVNLFVGNNPHATGGYDAWGRDDRALTIIRARARGQLDEVELDRVMRDLALEYVAQHPFETLARLPRKLAALYVFDEDGIHQLALAREHAAGRRDRGLVFYGSLALNQAYYTAIVALFLAACVRRIRFRAPLGLGFWVVATLTAYYLVFFGQSRFHFEMVPWMIVEGAWYATGADVGAPASEP